MEHNTNIIVPEYLDLTSYEWPEQRMSSGIATQQQFKYHAYKHKARNEPDYWYLVADTPNGGDHCYCGSSDPASRSQGFGGRAMEFPIEGHEPDRIITLYGPWHTNSHSVLKDTGVDYTRKHLTRGIIAEVSEDIGRFMCNKYSKIVHLELSGVIGAFDRIQTLAEEYVVGYGRPFYYQVESEGGGRASRILVKDMEGDGS